MENELKELVVIEEKDITTVFGVGGSEPILKGLKNKLEAFEPDISTSKGRDEIKSFARKFSSTKVYIEKLGKNLGEEAKKTLDVINGERRKIKNACDEYRDLARKPLTDWEEIDRERVRRHESAVNSLLLELEIEVEDLDHAKCILASTEAIVIDESFEEYKEAATRAKDQVVTHFKAKVIVLEAEERVKAEAEKLEQERIKREQDERDERLKQEAADKAKKEAEETAQKEADEKDRLATEAIEKANREALEAKRETERVEREKKEALEQAEIDKKKALNDERERVAREKAQKDAEEKKRQDNKRHRNRIIKEVTEDIKKCNILDDDAISSLIETIHDNKVRHLSIKF
ncbi:TolA protein [hydrothermal vent metagenome]|uniref:TolA protein n=1 Tax=hydrothermal vent metagenome TaxID=652676 RepID=A0A3B0W2U5_9ZZZZ